MTELLIKHFIPHELSHQEMRTACGKLGGTVGILANLMLFLFKLLAGLISGSIAVIADSVNNLSDAGSSLVALFSFKMSEMPPDENHPFGHGRVEYLSGLFISVLILMMGAELFKTSLGKIFSPKETIFSNLIFIILAVSVAVKLWLCGFNKKLSKKINSPALEAAAIDSRNDAVITSSVILCAAFTSITNINIDSITGIVIAVFIIISGINIMKDTINPLLGQAPDKELLDEIANKVLTTPGILGMHDFIVHDYGPGRKFATLHAEVNCQMSPLDSHRIIDSIEKRIKREDAVEMTIHCDPVILDDPLINKISGIIRKTLHEIDSRITMHDLRMEKDSDSTLWIFDIVIIPSVNINSAYAVKKLEERIEAEDKSYKAIITVDTDYSNSFTLK